MFAFLVSVEIEVRKHLTMFDYVADYKEYAIQKIIQDENVLFHWDMTSFNWDTAKANELLKIIVQHYFTVRGFSFAKAFMEKYKQSVRKITQKSKGLRKTLESSSTYHD